VACWANRPLFFCKSYKVCALTKEELDITNKEAIHKAFDRIRPDIVLNAVVLRNRFCDTDPIKAYAINAVGTFNLAVACRLWGSALAHISTDYVFNGETGNYSEADRAEPIGIYGDSKYQGEWLASAVCKESFIIRTAWLYGRYGDNFVHDIVNKSKQSDHINVVDDQFGSPTSVNELLKFISVIISSQAYGTYHAVCGGVASRYDFAKKILEATGARCEAVRIKTKDGMLRNTSLSAEKAAYLFDYRAKDWREAVEDYFK